MQHDRLYGYLDEFFADCVSRYPDRLVAGAQVDEWRGGEPDQLDRLRRQVEELGASRPLLLHRRVLPTTTSRPVSTTSPSGPLWDLVADLGIPIHWSPCAMLVPIAEDYIPGAAGAERVGRQLPADSVGAHPRTQQHLPGEGQPGPVQDTARDSVSPGAGTAGTWS